ncbi:hypothetical protein CCP2SC5_720012 [Azospirillaceae bacterium]
MTEMIYLIAVALLLGLVGLIAFMWALRNGQFNDLDGAACRILYDEEETGQIESHNSGSNQKQG